MKEQEIIELILAKDERGMDALLAHHGPLMRYVIAPILPNAHDQEECLSDAVMRVWDRIDQFDPDRGSWTAWVTAVTRSVALNRARNLKNATESMELPLDIPSPEPTPEELLLRRERQRELHQAISQLSQFERQIFYRKYYYLQSTAQIALETGMTERAIEGRLYRIKKRLRKLLGGEQHG